MSGTSHRARSAITMTLAIVMITACAHVAQNRIDGRVEANGTPLAGALITARGAGSLETTVYSAGDGGFSIENLSAGEYTVTARYPGHEPVRVRTATGAKFVRLASVASSDPLADVPTSTWLSLLPDGHMKREFILNCATCHEINKAKLWQDGKPRGQEQWTQVIALMKSLDVYAVVPPDFEDATFAAWLAENMGEAAIATLKPPRGADPALAGRTRITEYPSLKADELPHDLVVGPDGRIWVTAFWHSQIWAVDPASGNWEAFDVSEATTAAAQVRALEFDRNGKLWMVNGGTQSVVRLDPATREFKSFPVGMYAHDLVIDSKGDIWINDYFSKPERIARLSGQTGELTIFPLPSANLPDDEGKPLPYGLQIDGEDRLWSTQLAANTLVRFDTRTNESKLYQMPEANSGPRRNAIGRDGAIWIPEFNTGFLTRFDPTTERFERFDLGDSSLGPYDVEVDRRSGIVWIAASLGTALLRFDPATAAIERFPLPTEPAYMRHLAVDQTTGAVWSAYSSLPTVVPKIVRLECRD